MKAFFVRGPSNFALFVLVCFTALFVGISIRAQSNVSTLYGCTSITNCSGSANIPILVDTSGRPQISVTYGSPVSAANGGTGLSTYAVGDLIYASAITPTLSRLADVATGQVLTSGGAGVAPAWSANPIATSFQAGEGSQALPAWTFSAHTTSGMYSINGVPIIVKANSGADSYAFGYDGTGQFKVPVGGAMTWSSASDVTSAPDTDMSRCAAGVTCFGTGTPASFAGTTKFTTLQLVGKASIYNNVTTAGAGVPYIVAAANISAQSSNATITSYANPAADADFEVSGQMSVTASTTLATTITCTYTDVANVARTMILPIQTTTGTFVAAGAISGAGASIWETPTMHIRAKASTTITLLTSTGTFSGVTYSASGVIRQIN